MFILLQQYHELRYYRLDKIHRQPGFSTDILERKELLFNRAFLSFYQNIKFYHYYRQQNIFTALEYSTVQQFSHLQNNHMKIGPQLQHKPSSLVYEQYQVNKR